MRRIGLSGYVCWPFEASVVFLLRHSLDEFGEPQCHGMSNNLNGPSSFRGILHLRTISRNTVYFRKSYLSTIPYPKVRCTAPLSSEERERRAGGVGSMRCEKQKIC